MRRWLFQSVSGILTAGTLAAAAFAAVNLRGPTAEELVHDIAVIDREIALAERNLDAFEDRPLLAEQVELRLAVLQTTRAMLEQKRLSWLRGLKLIYRVNGWEVVPDHNAMVRLEAELDDAEAGMLTARRWVARSTNEVNRNLAVALEQVHMLTHAAIRQKMALEELGMTLPPPVEQAEVPQASPQPGMVGALGAASVR